MRILSKGGANPAAAPPTQPRRRAHRAPHGRAASPARPRLAIRLAALLLAGPMLAPAHAAPPVAQDLAGLFMQACLSYAGAPNALRAWAADRALPDLPEPARRAFLLNATGRVFDASTTTGKFVLVSTDDGLCSAVTNAVPGEAVVAQLEADLRQAGIRFRLVIERDDKAASALHYREYLATRDGRIWRILAATVLGQPSGHAMLTAGPE
jgi:hypothetical protein